MKIVTILPIAKGVPRKELTYFSAKDIPLGTLVTAPFGKRPLKGVVIATQDVRDVKGSIKTSSYALRNITTIHHNVFLPEALFTAAHKTASFFACKAGEIIETMIPQVYWDHYSSSTHSNLSQTTSPHLQSLQLPYTERVSWYKTTIRENLARKTSTLIIAPTIASVELLAQHIETGIADRLVVLHGKKTKKYLQKFSTLVFTDSAPVVVIATPSFGILVRNDWDTIVIENAGSDAYRHGFNPLFSYSFFLESFGKQLGARVLYADTILPLTIHNRILSREVIDARTTWHIKKPEDWSIVDMKRSEASKSFNLFDSGTIKKIEAALEARHPIAFLSYRKGLAPVTVCGDCGTVVTCPGCDAPLVLHKKKKVSTSLHSFHTYVCHRCTYTTEPQDHCLHCGSWKLNPLGISTDTIIAELEKLFPTIPITYLDLDGASSYPATAKKITTWQESKKAFLVGTPSMLPYLSEIPFGCIVSIDSLISLPLYTASERALKLTLSFLEKCTNGAVIQTRLKEHEVIKTLESENLIDFIEQERTLREQFHYPPNKVLIKISRDIIDPAVRSAMETTESILKQWNPDILVKKSPKPGTVTLVALLRIDPSTWKNDEILHMIIDDFRDGATIEINPESIL